MVLPPEEFSIGFLADHADALPTVARWLVDEWGDRQSASAVDELLQSLRLQMYRDRIPFQLVALIERRVIGVAMVKEHELRTVYPDTKNWVGSVFVEPVHRRRGVASALIERAVALARVLGVPMLHLQTEDLTGGLYAKLGWVPVRRVDHQGILRLIMALDLSGKSG